MNGRLVVVRYGGLWLNPGRLSPDRTHTGRPALNGRKQLGSSVLAAALLWHFSPRPHRDKWIEGRITSLTGSSLMDCKSDCAVSTTLESHVTDAALHRRSLLFLFHPARKDEHHWSTHPGFLLIFFLKRKKRGHCFFETQERKHWGI